MIFPFDLSVDKVKVIDIGARAVPEGFHYQKLLDSNACVVTAVEPDSTTNKWMAVETVNEIHNIALGSGGLHNMHVCTLPSCSSVLAPNMECLRFYSGMEFFYKVEGRVSVQTFQYDDFFSEASFDYMDIDVQGYELEILKKGERNVANLLGVHIEVSFIEKYKGQPLFRDVDSYLAARNFTFHCFTGYGTRSPRGIKMKAARSMGLINGCGPMLSIFIDWTMMSFGKLIRDC